MGKGKDAIPDKRGGVNGRSNNGGKGGGIRLKEGEANSAGETPIVLKKERRAGD